MVDNGLSLEAMVWRLFHEEPEVRVEQGPPLVRGCRCSLEHYAAVISSFPKADQIDMKDDAGVIVIDCAFCSKVFELPE